MIRIHGQKTGISCYEINVRSDPLSSFLLSLLAAYLPPCSTPPLTFPSSIPPPHGTSSPSSPRATTSSSSPCGTSFVPSLLQSVGCPAPPWAPWWSPLALLWAAQSPPCYLKGVQLRCCVYKLIPLFALGLVSQRWYKRGHDLKLLLRERLR